MALTRPEGFLEIVVKYSSPFVVIFDRGGDCWMWIKDEGRFGFYRGVFGPTPSTCTDMKRIQFVNQETARQLVSYLSNVNNAKQPVDPDTPVPVPVCPQLPEQPPRKVAPGPASRFARVPRVVIEGDKGKTDINAAQEITSGRVSWGRS